MSDQLPEIVNCCQANNKPPILYSYDENGSFIEPTAPSVGRGSSQISQKFWGQRHYLRVRTDLQLPMLMQLPHFLPQLQKITNYNAETIELKSHTWNTMVLNEQTGQVSNIKLKIHHLRPLPVLNEQSFVPLNYANVTPAYTIAQPLAVTNEDNEQFTFPIESVETPGEDLLENSTMKVETSDDDYLVEVQEVKCSDFETLVATGSNEINFESYSELIEADSQPLEIEIPFAESNTANVNSEYLSHEKYFVECNDGVYSGLNTSSICQSGIYRVAPKKDQSQNIAKFNKKSSRAVTSKRILNGRILKVKVEDIATPFVNFMNTNSDKNV